MIALKTDPKTALRICFQLLYERKITPTEAMEQFKFELEEDEE